MAAAGSKSVDPRRLAEQGVELRGDMVVSAMPRLAALTSGADASVSYALEFGVRDNGRAGVSGTAQVGVELACQRCLAPMTLDLEAAFQLELVDADDVDPLGAESEPLFVDGPLELAAMLEEELLLEVPFAPAHANGECAVDGHYRMQAEDGRKPSPFAALKGLKTNG